MSSPFERLIFVDCEAEGPCPSKGKLTEIGAVAYISRNTFYGDLRGDSFDQQPALVFARFAEWLIKQTKAPIFISDNPAFDWQWINDGFHLYLGHNPFGYSARRIGDFYAGLVGDFTQASAWKKLRITKHTHNPVDDAMGNVEAFARMVQSEK